MEILQKYTGESLTIGIAISDGYDLANIESIKLYLAGKIYPHTLEERMIRCEITSDQTALLYGAKSLWLWFDDSIHGVRKYNLGDIVFNQNKAKESNESVNTGFDVVIPLTITESTVTVGSVVYNYFKGTDGLAGKGEVSRELISTVGLVKTYRITYTDSTTFEYSVSDGEKGDKGDKGDKGSDANVTSVNVIAALGFTPENAANKQNSLEPDGTGTKFPTVDAVNEGLGLKANKEQKAWITPTLLNGWTNVEGFTPCQYMKDNFGFVHIRGRLKGPYSSTITFALPSGYIPEFPVQFIATTNSRTSPALAYVSTNGNIYITESSATFIDFGEIIYKVP